MTLFHFGNCFALAYFPYFITYKCSGLSEYSAFWRCVQAGATYVLVQLGKALELRPSLTFVRPHWLRLCGEQQRALPAQPFAVRP
ncbi:DNA repair protein XRCC1 [Patagioenas fasciata monilis]|uniref:BOS complex subunit TMEM147 n=1 Tax=Patagioenas fasciata monilis TaxID=372326 RepID=A0A1V4K2W5_PATFA|nr:DNA repair protein XRCC1 [Patagioenas fasciata monilis]